MSKAFTKEEDVELPPEAPRPNGPVWMTSEGRARLVLRVEELRADGATTAASTLAARLEVARVAPGRAPGDASPVRLGDRVRVRSEQGERWLFLVGPDEVDLTFEGVEAVSLSSPLGTALIGSEPGEVVEVERPGRPAHELELLEVRATNEEPDITLRAGGPPRPASS